MSKSILDQAVDMLSKSGFVGFDDIFKTLNTSFADTSYPPSNIAVKRDLGKIVEYQIQLAVAGFDKDDLTVESIDHIVTIKGNQKQLDSKDDWDFAFQGLARRSFKRQYSIQDNIEVVGSKLKNGLLTITLRPKKIEKEKTKVITIE